MANYKIKATALSPIHIGSGDTLSSKYDYVTGVVDGVSCVGVVDPKKVLSIITERNLASWTTSIERGESTDAFLKRIVKDISMEQYCSRILDQWCDHCKDDIKTFTYDGLGHPYIPGSSIKGAIRSAVLGTIGTYSRITDDIQFEKKKKAGARVEGNLFGNTPNNSVFRFLKVGDAVIKNVNLGVIDVCHINERKVESYWDKSKHQLLEAFLPEDSVLFDLSLDLEYYNTCSGKVSPLPRELSSIDSLFDAINSHTAKLLKEELEIWKPLADSDHKGSDYVESYIEAVEDILRHINLCKSGTECVLRLGAGSGWRFMTGAWPEDYDDFDKIADMSRPNNYKYSEYRFPKTRRIDADGDDRYLLGFMKLSIQQ